MTDGSDLHHLRRAARLARRGHGGAEPNPLVGCVIVAGGGRVVGEGCHRRCGGPHAEVIALARAGSAAKGATAYVTLEPCRHRGRTGPCTDALIGAGVGRVVIARPDPHPEAGGGAESLRRAGIRVDLVGTCPEAAAVGAPFVHRTETGRPWVIAKWAQTVDGRIATRSGESQWISGPRSRALVHRERGRVDAVMTGIGTVLADDPLLTARGVRRRRIARRVVIDPWLETPLSCRLVGSLDQAPLTIVCGQEATKEREAQAGQLDGAGAEIIALNEVDDDLPMETALRELSSRHEISTVLVEAGAGLLGRLFAARLVQEAWVVVGPLLLGDDHAMPAVRGLHAERLIDGMPLRLLGQHRRDGDVVLHYRIGEESD